jgi:ribosomal protein S6E (S10)
MSEHDHILQRSLDAILSSDDPPNEVVHRTLDRNLTEEEVMDLVDHIAALPIGTEEEGMRFETALRKVRGAQEAGVLPRKVRGGQQTLDRIEAKLKVRGGHDAKGRKIRPDEGGGKHPKGHS